MSDHQNKSEEKPYEIELLWEIGAFLPERQNDLAKDNIKTISERLNPSMFETIESTKQYWSVPERLLDIRILMLFRDSLIGPQSHNTEDNENPNKDADLISDLRLIQFELYLIVSKFAEWCYTFEEAERKLRSGNHISDNRQKSIDHLRSAFVTYNDSDKLSKMHVDGDYKEEYRAKYYDILKDVTEKAYTEINESFRTNYETKVKYLLKELKKIARKLGINSPTIDAICNYQDDSSRCVALLMFLPENQTGNQKHQPKNQYLAFSGFLDCEDTKLPEEFNSGFKLADEFKKISEEYGAKLVTLSHDNVDRISTYKIAKDLSLKEAQLLRSAVKEAQMKVNEQKKAKAQKDAKTKKGSEQNGAKVQKDEEMQNVKSEDEKISNRYYGPVKGAYSCCERKILAEVQSKQTNKNARLLVKFQPCFDCYAALKKWKEKNNIKLSVDYIPRSTLIKSGNILSEPNESPINPSANDD